MSSEVRYTRTPDRVLKERLKQAAPQPVVTPVLDKKVEVAPAEMSRPVAQPVAPVSRGDAVQRSAPPPAESQGVHFGRTPTRMSPQASARLRNETAPVTAQAPEPQQAPRTSNPLIFRKLAGQGAPATAKAAPLEMPAVQQSYSFLWRPGTYLIDPSLQSQSEVVIEQIAETPVRPARKVATERMITRAPVPAPRPEPVQIETAPWEDEPDDLDVTDEIEEEDLIEVPRAAQPVKPTPRVANIKSAPTPANDSFGKAHALIPSGASFDFELPALDLLAEPHADNNVEVPPEVLQENAAALENVLWDFNVKGEIINVHPGPVVTLYELEPAPGTKSSRVISLADDIARSMSAVSARVAVVQGRN
ncbi:DNA translocase FtsK, partial [Microvirga sp. 2YAF29]